jgi:hypothetical protein
VIQVFAPKYHYFSFIIHILRGFFIEIFTWCIRCVEIYKMYTSVKSKGKLRRENNVRAQGRIKDLCLEGKNLKNNNLGG